jgi:hypothetical protein
VKNAVSALKKRNGAHEGAIREIWFDHSGIHLSEPLTRLRGVPTVSPPNSLPARARDGPKRHDAEGAALRESAVNSGCGGATRFGLRPAAVGWEGPAWFSEE